MPKQAKYNFMLKKKYLKMLKLNHVFSTPLKVAFRKLYLQLVILNTCHAKFVLVTAKIFPANKRAVRAGRAG